MRHERRGGQGVRVASPTGRPRRSDGEPPGDGPVNNPSPVLTRPRVLLIRMAVACVAVWLGTSPRQTCSTRSTDRAARLPRPPGRATTSRRAPGSDEQAPGILQLQLTCGATTQTSQSPPIQEKPGLTRACLYLIAGPAFFYKYFFKSPHRAPMRSGGGKPKGAASSARSHGPQGDRGRGSGLGGAGPGVIGSLFSGSGSLFAVDVFSRGE